MSTITTTTTTTFATEDQDLTPEERQMQRRYGGRNSMAEMYTGSSRTTGHGRCGGHGGAAPNSPAAAAGSAAFFRLEAFCDAILQQHGKRQMAPVGRALLLSTFVEDGLRMVYQWGDQADYMQQEWGAHSAVAFLFVAVNLFGQLLPCAAIMNRTDNKSVVRGGVAALLAVMLMQTLAYTALWSAQFFLRNCAVAGSLVLVWAETEMRRKASLAGMLDAGDHTTRADSLLAVGRTMCIIMFLTMMRFDTAARALFEAVGLALMGCVAAGFKAKVAAVALIALLSVHNLATNFYLAEPAHSAEYDLKKFDFYQTLSVIGGLLLVVAHGPGGVSVDERKKSH